MSPPSTKSSPVSKRNMTLEIREKKPPQAKFKTKVEQFIESDSDSEDDIDLEDAEDEGRPKITPILLQNKSTHSLLFQSLKLQWMRNFLWRC